jgi:hypothetical protein
VAVHGGERGKYPRVHLILDYEQTIMFEFDAVYLTVLHTAHDELIVVNKSTVGVAG